MKEYTIKLTDEQAKEVFEKYGDQKVVKVRPNNGERYVMLNDVDMDTIAKGWGSSHDHVWDSGNGYFTQEEAKKELKWRKARQVIRDFIRKEGIELFSEERAVGGFRYCLRYHYETNLISYGSIDNATNFGYNFYFKTSRGACRVMDNISYEILKTFLTTNP